MSEKQAPRDAAIELLPCPFCGREAIKTFCCGLAIPNCPRCSDLFGCNHCDVWFDTADEWNTRFDAGEAFGRADGIEDFVRRIETRLMTTDNQEFINNVTVMVNRIRLEMKEATDGKQ